MCAASLLACTVCTRAGLRRLVDVLTMQPASVGCLQVQPIDPIGPGSDVQSEVGREQVSIIGDAAVAAVNPLRERFLLFRPAQAGLLICNGFRGE